MQLTVYKIPNLTNTIHNIFIRIAEKYFNTYFFTLRWVLERDILVTKSQF